MNVSYAELPLYRGRAARSFSNTIPEAKMKGIYSATLLVLFATPALGAKVIGPQTTPPAHPLPPGTVIQAKPDLTANLDGIFSPGGVITIRNAGAGPAGASVAQLSCEKIANGNVPLPAPQPCLTMKSQWANGVLFGTTGNPVRLHVPALAAGAEFSYTLPFWSHADLVHGRYELLLEADIHNSVAETNESNNVASVTATRP